MNMTLPTDAKLIPEEDKNKSEVHFVTFEGVVDDHVVSFWSLFKTLRVLTKPIEFKPKDNEWKIVDFDNFMKGNPHECFTDEDVNRRKRRYG